MQRTRRTLATTVLAMLTCLIAGPVAAQDPDPDPEQGSVSRAPEPAPPPPPSEAEASGGGGGGGMGSTLSQGSIDLWAGFRIGAGGELDFDPGGDDDLRPTFGLQLGGEYILHRYVALGGEFRVAWLNTDGFDDADRDRFKLIDFVVKPRGRYVIEKIGLEVYGTLPMGLTVAAMPDPWNGGAGFTLGIGWGAIYMFTDMIGVNLEMSWLKHWFDAELEPFDDDFDLSTSQFNFLVLNAVIVL